MTGKYIRRIVLSIIIWVFPFVSMAQLCTGSFGDPVVNITFGDGITPDFNFTPPSAYTFTNAACPNDGFYTIRNNSSGCFSGSWHTVSSDHTGGGAFMLINASYTPGDFFLATVSGLCPNTTYEFAAWVMNVLRTTTGIQPDLTFTVENTSGAVLNQFFTGGIVSTPNPQWNQYGFNFTTGATGTAIILRITNNAPGGIGNDLALDDITFRPCGPQITSVIQGNNPRIDHCVNDQVAYTFDGTVSTGYISPVYQWQLSTDSGKIWNDISGATSASYVRQPTVIGNFWYRLSVAETGNVGIPGCRISSNVLIINVHPKPGVSAGPDRILIKGNTTTLLGKVTGESPVYNWWPPDDLNDVTKLQPLANPGSDMQYHLSAISLFGCTNEDFMLVKVVAGIFVPTAFTPNNDGKNDSWRIPYLDPELGATVRVFNRWGQIVYTT
ncbi:MAG: gliding motility-associated C-terminal domain-containing protein, partial [Chitinophagaceae bacterium]